MHKGVRTSGKGTFSAFINETLFWIQQRQQMSSVSCDFCFLVSASLFTRSLPLSRAPIFRCMAFRLPTRNGLLTALSLASMSILEGDSGQSLSSCSTSGHCPQVPRVASHFVPRPSLDHVPPASYTGWGEHLVFSWGSRGHLLSTGSSNLPHSSSHEHSWGSNGL